jgi:hypothetical protein
MENHFECRPRTATTSFRPPILRCHPKDSRASWIGIGVVPVFIGCPRGRKLAWLTGALIERRHKTRSRAST